jgi:NTE family protein
MSRASSSPPDHASPRGEVATFVVGYGANVTKALVLGGGGITGIAWEVGVLLGLRRAGVDLTDADVVVGTSAGAVVGALVTTGVDLEQLARVQHEVYPDELPVQVDFARGAQAFALLGDSSLDALTLRRRIGELALAAQTGRERDRLEVFAARLPKHEWPDRPLLVTTVDAGSGEFVVWDRDTSAPLVSAVAASCAVPCVFPPVTIDGRRYMDGGVRSGTNADLAEGASAVVVLAPMAGVSRRHAPPEELELLRRTARVVTVSPDAAGRQHVGGDILDASRRPAALGAGLAQAPAWAERVAAAWR